MENAQQMEKAKYIWQHWHTPVDVLRTQGYTAKFLQGITKSNFEFSSFPYSRMSWLETASNPSRCWRWQTLWWLIFSLTLTSIYMHEHASTWANPQINKGKKKISPNHKYLWILIEYLSSCICKKSSQFAMKMGKIVKISSCASSHHLMVHE